MNADQCGRAMDIRGNGVYDWVDGILTIVTLPLQQRKVVIRSHKTSGVNAWLSDWEFCAKCEFDSMYIYIPLKSKKMVTQKVEYFPFRKKLVDFSDEKVYKINIIQ